MSASRRYIIKVLNNYSGKQMKISGEDSMDNSNAETTNNRANTGK